MAQFRQRRVGKTDVHLDERGRPWTGHRIKHRLAVGSYVEESQVWGRPVEALVDEDGIVRDPIDGEPGVLLWTTEDGEWPTWYEVDGPNGRFLAGLPWDDGSDVSYTEMRALGLHPADPQYPIVREYMDGLSAIERAARESAVAGLAADIATEAAERAIQDDALAGSIAAEATARADGDATVQAAVDAEAFARAADVAGLEGSIADEATARADADTALGAAIANEASLRADGDAASLAAVDAEAAARAADVTTLEGSIAAEASARGAADDLLSGAIADEATARAAGDADEAAARTAAVAAVADAVVGEAATREAAIATEAGARQAADSTLQANIEAEGAARGTDIATVNAQIATVVQDRDVVDADLQAQIAAEVTARETSATVLEGLIDDEATTRAAADTALAADLDAETVAREAAIQEEADLRAALIAAEEAARIAEDEALDIAKAGRFTPNTFAEPQSGEFLDRGGRAINPRHAEFATPADGIASSRAGVLLADDAAVAAGVALEFGPGRYRFDAHTTILAHVIVLPGAVFLRDDAVTLTFAGGVEAGPYQIIAEENPADGERVVFSGDQGAVNAAWWGARPRLGEAGAAVNGTALNRAVDSARNSIDTTQSGEGLTWKLLVKVEPGTYYTDRTLWWGIGGGTLGARRMVIDARGVTIMATSGCAGRAIVETSGAHWHYDILGPMSIRTNDTAGSLMAIEDAPQCGLLAARDTASGNAGRHSYFRVLVEGSFQLAPWINLQAEAHTHYYCTAINHHPEGRFGLLNQSTLFHAVVSDNVSIPTTNVSNNGMSWYKGVIESRWEGDAAEGALAELVSSDGATFIDTIFNGNSTEIGIPGVRIRNDTAGGAAQTQLARFQFCRFHGQIQDAVEVHNTVNRLWFAHNHSRPANAFLKMAAGATIQRLYQYDGTVSPGIGVTHSIDGRAANCDIRQAEIHAVLPVEVSRVFEGRITTLSTTAPVFTVPANVRATVFFTDTGRTLIYGDTNVETLSDHKTLVRTDREFQRLNGGAAHRDVILPTTHPGMKFTVVNAGATNNLVLKRGSGATLFTLTPGDMAVCYGTAGNHGWVVRYIAAANVAVT
jgi:hypothetical protein